jgi:hypothetical protein
MTGPSMVHLDDLLQKTSRSLAVTVPLLSEPTRKAVSTASLMLLALEALASGEDRGLVGATLTDLAEALKLDGVRRYGELRRQALQWTKVSLPAGPGLLELLEKVPEVVAEVDSLEPSVGAAITAHLVQTTRALASPRGQTVTTMDEFAAECTLGAGSGASMLARLFLLEVPALQAVEGELVRRAASMGQGLKLVKLLVQSGFPPGLERDAVCALTRRALGDGEAFVHLLQRAGAPQGLVSFSGLTTLMGTATLASVEAGGAGAMVSSGELARLYAVMMADLAAGRPLSLRR